MKNRMGRNRLIKNRLTRKNKRKNGNMKIQYNSFSVNDNISSAKNTAYLPIISLSPLRLSTLVMYDPDSITPPSWLHYLVINIPNGDITKGDTIIPYNGPTPPPGTGRHHYIFELLEQRSNISTLIKNRNSFDINTFKESNSLVLRAKKEFMVDS
jgi:phosphatidylethanolamine-binding protein (PEBP) family uncharacterized protein